MKTKTKSQKERYAPLKKLAGIWFNDFLQNRETYLNILIPAITSGDFSRFSESEITIIKEIKANFKKSEWKNFKILFLSTINALEKEIYNSDVLTKAEVFIQNDNFLSFEKLYLGNKNLLSKLQKICAKNLEKYIKNLRADIISLSFEDFKKASSFFYTKAKNLPEKEKGALGLFMEDVEDLIVLLSSFRFKEADAFFYKKKIIKKDEYENLKKKYVLGYFSNENIDEEKALAISSISSNVLLRARAGSGKTSTICLKTVFLMEKYGIRPDEILILAFNKEAKVKLRKDLGEKYGLNNYLNYKNASGFENAKTFHSFAKSICDAQNDNKKENGGRKIADERMRKNLITKAIKSVFSDEKNKKVFYEFYKTSLEVPFKNEVNLSKSSNISFIKGLSQITLRGEIVKSLGEKYIADFLFENGIDYEYEKCIIFTKEEKDVLNIDDDWNIYRPDFYINYQGCEFYLEHWGVDEDVLEPAYARKNNVIDDVSKYVKNMHIKRRYFRKKNIPLIETWAKHSQIKENFEIILKNTLQKFGIKPVKQDENRLFEEVFELNIKSFYKTVESFISTVKKSKLDSFYIERKLKDKNISKRARIFLGFGHRVYLEYQKLLADEGLYDFDDLVIFAAEKVIHTKGDLEFRIFGSEKVKINRLKYILIDEYQDFSKLFFDLILAIKCFNPKLKIFATGDDWQAINGFAGSSLYYFKNFKKLFNNSEVYNLTNNYRSYKNVIETSNSLMVLEGVPSKPVKANEGEVLKINIDKTFVNKEKGSDLIYSFKKDSGLIKAKYLKTVHRLIRLHPNKSFLILSRLNKISGSSLENEFAAKLLRMKTVDNAKVKVMTIHKSKGLEADVVILLRAINGVVPFVHPDFEISTVLCENWQDGFKSIEDEEKRLFYVALTRGREKVYILTESRLETVYLKGLNLKEVSFKELNFENRCFLE